MSMYTTNYPQIVETSPVGSGWSPLIAAGVGGVIGYFVGRNNNSPCGGSGLGGGYGCGCNGGQTVFQQGEYTGESRAADNFIAQTVNGFGNKLDALAASIAQQKITDQANEIQALKTQQLIQGVNCAQSTQLTQILQLLSSIVTGCGVKAYTNGCGNGCGYTL